MASYLIRDYLLFLLYMFLCSVAIISNSILLKVMFRLKKFTNTYKLIANQSFSDGIFGVIFLYNWYLCSRPVIDTAKGLIACEMILICEVSTVAVSSLTPAFIALDRYLTLYYPKQLRMRANVCIPFIWLLAVCIAVINDVNLEDLEYFTPDRLIGCRIAMQTEIPFFKNRYHFLIVMFIIVCVAGITSFSYFRVICKVYNRKMVGIKRDAQLEKEEKAKKRTISMLIVMTVVFIGLNTPIYLTMLLDVFYPSMLSCNGEEPSVHFLFFRFLCVLSTIVNPFILAYFNVEFRDEVVKLFKSLSEIFSSDDDKGLETTKCDSIAFTPNQAKVNEKPMST